MKMKKIVFATNNQHKLSEVRDIFEEKFKVVSLAEINCNEDIPETAETLEENAALKAQHVYENYQLDCFADDTGLEIEALGGKPGVFSARYAGEPSNSEKNVEKILKEMHEIENRNAQFRTVICLIEDGKKSFFEGIIKGTISKSPSGNNGFGYDPIFIPYGYDKCFAELSSEEKNKISHRALAVNKLTEYLKISKLEQSTIK